MIYHPAVIRARPAYTTAICLHPSSVSINLVESTFIKLVLPELIKSRIHSEAYNHLIKMLKLSSVCRRFTADITLQPSELPRVYKLSQSFSFM